MKGFPDGLVVRTQHFHCHWPELIPGWGLRSHNPHSAAKNTQKLAYMIRSLYISLVNTVLFQWSPNKKK